MTLKRVFLAGILLLACLAVPTLSAEDAAGGDAAATKKSGVGTAAAKANDNSAAIAKAAAAAAKAAAAAAEAVNAAVEAAGGGGDSDDSDEEEEKPATAKDTAAKADDTATGASSKEAKQEGSAKDGDKATGADNGGQAAAAAEADKTAASDGKSGVSRRDAARGSSSSTEEATDGAADASESNADADEEVDADAEDAAAGDKSAEAGAKAKSDAKVAAPAAADAAAGDTQADDTKPMKKSARAKKDPFVNKVVDFAPAANVTFGDDIDDEGACAEEIEKYCEDVDEGEGNLAECISENIAASEEPNPSGEVPVISDACWEEVHQFKIQRSSNINANVPLAKACKVDADKFCNVTWFFGYKAGQVIACLRDVRAQVSRPCKQELFKVMLAAAVDIRADPMLYEACKEDSETLCKDVKNGGGRIQACLRDKRMQLSWACEEQLFRQEMENADDIRLSVRLFSKCMPDKRKFCKDIEPGNARTKDCLEENREELSEGCREEVDAMIERRVRDFRLDSKLRNVCENEIFNMCAYFGDLDDIDTYDSSVINCLQDYSGEIKNAECKSLVRKYLQLASQDIRFDVPLAEACFEDRQKYCSNVPPGSARVIRCLTTNRDNLSPVCRATLFDEEVRFSENIDFQYPMKSACTKEIQRFCKDIPHGNARVIRCLQDNKDDKDFGKPCAEEVRTYEAEVSKDYRFNYRLHNACQKDVEKLCPGLCQNNDGNPCGGKVLRCLTDKLDDISDEGCRKEVFYYEKMEVSNFKNDILLAEACRTDVEQFCSTVEPGEGRVHKCLRDNRKKLSEACRKEELLLEEKEANSIELSVSLLKACNAERKLFCSEVQPGQARVFRCLAENMNDPDFGMTCRNQIITKLQRRQANWKLDPPLRKACKSDVLTYCSAEESLNSEEGLVYKCLIDNFNSINSGCQKELGRAVHMAFFIWSEGQILTSDCDDDIQRLCLADRPNMHSRPGAVGTCLAQLLEKQEHSTRRRMPEVLEDFGALSAACAKLADIAEPPNMKQAFESSLYYALLKDQLERVEIVTGLPVVKRDSRGNTQGVSLTGWMAMLGMTAMIVLVIFGAYTGYKRVRGGPDRDYTLVVKSQHK